MGKTVSFSWKDSYRDHWAVEGESGYVDDESEITLWWFKATGDGGKSFSFPVEVGSGSNPTKKCVVLGLMAYFNSVALSLMTDETFEQAG